MSLFKSRERRDAETVAAKLKVARAERNNAEQKLRDAALTAALSSDPWAAEPFHEAVRRARERVELLEAAAEEAERLEVRRQGERQAELRASQNRAIAQHRSRLIKNAKNFQKTWSWCVEYVDEMLTAGQAIRQLLPPDSAYDGFRAAVSYRGLRAACEAEMNRVGVENPNDPATRPGAPGTSYHPFFHPLTATPLADDLEERLGRLYDALIGRAPPPVELPEPQPALAPPLPQLPPPAATAVSTGLIEAGEPSQPPPAPVQAPPFDPESQPHAANPEAQAEFDAERERLRNKARTAEPAEVGA